MLVGGADTYNNRCLDCHNDKARDSEKVAKAKGKTSKWWSTRTLNTPTTHGSQYRTDYARDTRKRAEEWSKRAHVDLGK